MLGRSAIARRHLIVTSGRPPIRKGRSRLFRTRGLTRRNLLSGIAMTNKRTSWLPSVFYWLLHTPAAAVFAQQPLVADLRGNGQVQKITLKTVPDGDFGTYQISVGNASFTSKYFSAAGDVPEVRIVKLDEKDAAKQIMVTMVWALDCSYEFLSYDGSSLELRGRLESNHCLYEPELLGNGEVSLRYWEGFWASTRLFRLTGESQHLQPVPQRFYDLDVNGVTLRRVAIYVEGSNEPAAYLDTGQGFSLKRFDMQTGRYQVWVDNLAKGWAQIGRDNVSGLPWAN